MQMSLQESLTTWFNKPTMDPTQYFSYTRHQNDAVYTDDYEDRLSANDTVLHRHVASAQPYDKEPMFEKPLTPSDVGKLNRLVIPKQHAEKYFPLGGGGGGDAAGTLLSFEDEAGKCWRFRYSYWNSSQSYVLTKGWSRYVKDKRLDAGDVVFFERHRNEPEQLFIGWRRRGAAPPATSATAFCHNAVGYYEAQDSRGQGQGGGGVEFPPYRPDGPHVAAGELKATAGSSNTNSNANTRRLVRLFGVNLECQLDNSSSQTTSSDHHQLQLQQQQAYHSYFDYNQNHQSHHHMDMDFAEGVKQMGNRLG